MCGLRRRNWIALSQKIVSVLPETHSQSTSDHAVRLAVPQETWKTQWPSRPSEESWGICHSRDKGRERKNSIKLFQKNASKWFWRHIQLRDQQQCRIRLCSTKKKRTRTMQATTLKSQERRNFHGQVTVVSKTFGYLSYVFPCHNT